MTAQPLRKVGLTLQDTNITHNPATVDEPPAPWMLVNGSAMLDAVVLDDKALASFEDNTATPGIADLTRYFAINLTEIVTWVVNGEPFSEPSRPIVYGSASDGWNASTTLFNSPNTTVDLIIKVANGSMDTGKLSRLPGSPILQSPSLQDTM